MKKVTNLACCYAKLEKSFAKFATCLWKSMIMNDQFKVFALILVSFSSITAFAGDFNAFSYNGKITKPDGSALTSTNVVFTLSVYSPSPGSCLLYSETHTVNMAGSNGSFALAVGTGTRTDSGSHTFLRAFANLGTISSLTCASGTSYSPALTDDRSFVVQINDGGTLINLDPQTIRSVPYAMQAEQISGYSASNLVRVNGTASSNLSTTDFTNLVNFLNTIATLANGDAIKSDGAGGWVAFSPSAGSGTVTQINTGAGLTGGPITSTGTLT